MSTLPLYVGILSHVYKRIKNIVGIVGVCGLVENSIAGDKDAPNCEG
jgi:hypothetical protein